MWGSTGFGGRTKCSVFINLEPRDNGTEGDDDNKETNTWAMRMPGSLMAGWLVAHVRWWGWGGLGSGATKARLDF